MTTLSAVDAMRQVHNRLDAQSRSGRVRSMRRHCGRLCSTVAESRRIFEIGDGSNSYGELKIIAGMGCQ